MPPLIDIKKCIGCGTCELHCPLDVISIDGLEMTACVKYPDECWHCGVCRQECPEEAIKIIFPERMIKCCNKARETMITMFQ